MVRGSDKIGLSTIKRDRTLTARGLELVTDISASEYRARYPGDPGEGYEFYHVVYARVVGA